MFVDGGKWLITSKLRIVERHRLHRLKYRQSQLIAERLYPLETPYIKTLDSYKFPSQAIFIVTGGAPAMLSTIIAILASQVVGALWYSPVVVGKVWASYAYPGLTLEEIKKPLSRTIIYAIAFVSSVFITLLLKYYLLQSVFTLGGALSVSLLLGGFSACLEVCHYGFEGRPWQLFVIDHLHNFFNILVISCVLVLL